MDGDFLRGIVLNPNRLPSWGAGLGRHFSPIFFALLMAFSFSLTSCVSKKVWIDPGLRTAEKEGPQMRMRRLVVLPARYEARGMFQDKQALQSRMVRTLASETHQNLAIEKGYEVIPLDLYLDMSRAKLDLSPEELEKRVLTLSDWAKASPDGADPPEGVVHSVARIGKPFDADGILVVQGYSDPADKSLILTVLTASLTWPLILLNNDWGLRADLYEVSSGRIIWRSSMSSKEQLTVRQLLQGFYTENFDTPQRE